MPGIQFMMAGQGELLPPVQSYPLANNLTGADATAVSGSLFINDIVVLSTKAALTSNGVAVVRKLLAADVTALYKEGANTVGILGICMDNINTNAAGIINSTPQLINNVPPVIFSTPAGSAMYGVDPVSGRNMTGVFLATPQTQWQGFLDPAQNVTNMYTLPGTEAGLTITTDQFGRNFYSINPNATTKILTINSVDAQDPSYGTTGALVRFTFNPAYLQYSNLGGNYSTN